MLGISCITTLIPLFFSHYRFSCVISLLALLFYIVAPHSAIPHTIAPHTVALQLLVPFALVLLPHSFHITPLAVLFFLSCYSFCIVFFTFSFLSLYHSLRVVLFTSSFFLCFKYFQANLCSSSCVVVTSLALLLILLHC